MDNRPTLRAMPSKTRSSGLIVRLGFVVESAVKLNVLAAVLFVAWRTFSA